MAVVQGRAPAQTAASARLPIFGIAGDIGLPDGAIASLVVRPRSWVRMHAGIGSNGISLGWRASLALLPFKDGPALVAEYGRFPEGNANPLACRVAGCKYRSPLLERVGYEYLNLHLGLNMGYRRVTFFLQGGLTLLRGQLHNVDRVVRGAAASDATVEVAVGQDPRVKARGVSGKVGLLVYVW